MYPFFNCMIGMVFLLPVVAYRSPWVRPRALPVVTIKRNMSLIPCLGRFGIAKPMVERIWPSI